MKKILICIIAGVIATMSPAISFAETTINNVLNRHAHTEDYMWLQEGVTERVVGRQFIDTSEEGDSTITYDNMEDVDQMVNENGEAIIDDQTLQQEDITAEQRELLEYFQNMLKNSERGSSYYTPIETDAYGDWFNTMLAMSGSREHEWMEAMKNSVDFDSGAYTLPNNRTDPNALYQTYAKQLALTKDEWYNLLKKFAKNGALGLGDNTWLKGGLGIGDNYRVGLHYDGYSASAPQGYDPSGAIDELEDKFNKARDDLKKKFENSGISVELLRLFAVLLPQPRPWWELLGGFPLAIGKSVHSLLAGADNYLDAGVPGAEKKIEALNLELKTRNQLAESKMRRRLRALQDQPKDKYEKTRQEIIKNLEEYENEMIAKGREAESKIGTEQGNGILMELQALQEKANKEFKRYSDELDREIKEYEERLEKDSAEALKKHKMNALANFSAMKNKEKIMKSLRDQPQDAYESKRQSLLNNFDSFTDEMAVKVYEAKGPLSSEAQKKLEAEVQALQERAKGQIQEYNNELDKQIKAYEERHETNKAEQLKNYKAKANTDLNKMLQDMFNDSYYETEQGLASGDPLSEAVDYYIYDTGITDTLDALLISNPHMTNEEYWESVGEYWNEKFPTAINNIWTDWMFDLSPTMKSLPNLPPKENATPDDLRDKMQNATAEQRAAFDEFDNATKEKEKAAQEAAKARANGDAELEAAWRQREAELDAIAKAALDRLYDSVGYENFDVPEEYVELIRSIYDKMDDGYRLQALSLEQEMLELAKKLKAKNAQYVNRAELEKRMNSLFGDKNVTGFNYNAFLNDYNKVHSKMSNVGKEYAPIAFNYFNDASGWADYKDYIDRLLFGDQYGLKEYGGLNSFYNNGNLTLTVMKEKVLRQITENVTYYGHFNQDFLWRVENSAGKEVGVYQTDAPEVYLTAGSPDKYHVTENQRADVYLVTARIYGVRYYVFNPITNTVLLSWEEKDMDITPQPNTASSRWVKVWTMTYTTGKSKSRGLKRNSDLWDTQQIQ